MNAHSPTRVARNSPLWDAIIPRLLLAEIYQFDLSKSNAGIAIKKLISEYKSEGFRLDPDSTIIEKYNWTTPGTIFLSIPYKNEEGEERRFAEAFPILVKYVVNEEHIEIRDIEADLSSFDS